MAPNPRVAKAFRAMREIGIPEEKVKPVLKNLLKLYEKNWELIEEENYRALADAIFDQDETQAEEQKRENERAALEKMEEEAQVNEEPERPLKRLRLRHQQGHASPSVVNSSPRSSATLLRQPKEEEVELPDETRPRLRSQKVMESSSSQPNTENKRAGSHPSSSQPLVRNKGKQPVLHNRSAVQEGVDASLLDAANKTRTLATSGHRSDSVSSAILLKEKGKEPILSQIPLNTDRSTHIVCLKEPKLEPGIILTPKQQAHNSNALIKPKDEPVTDDVPQFEIPLAVILPVPDPLNEENSFRVNDSVRGPDCPEPLVSHSVHDEDRNDVIPASPNERRPNWGLSNFVDEVSSNLEKASSNNGEEIIAVTPAIDIQKQPIEALDALGGRDKPVGPSNGSTKAQCSAEVARSRVPRQTPSSNGNDCGETQKDTDVYSSEIDKEKELNGFERANSHPAVQQRQPTPVGEKPLHDVVDIAKGQEKVVISVVNEVNDECLPSFRYIAQNVVFQNAYVNFSLARIGESCCSTCLGDCLSSPTPCACAHESGGDYAYTSEGLVKEDILKECILMNRDPQKHCLFYCKDCPLERSKNDDIVEQCKGHSVRRFIKECWWKCGCTKHCGNRVVQRGINRNLQVFMTPEGKGWGLRTLEDIPKGAFVCEYVGEILTNAELFDRVSQSSSNEEHAYPVLLDADWASEGVLKDEEALCLDATHYGNVARFVNHRCFDSNMVEIPVEVETPDHHYYHLAFFTTRKVKALEELTWDYGIDFDDHDHPVKAFKCQCGSKYCRNMKRINRSRSGRRR